MALNDRSLRSGKQVAPTANPALWLFAAALGLALLAGFALKAQLSPDALGPVVATLIFGLAAAIAGAALLLRRMGRSNRWLDVAGVLTLVGVAITTLIEPDQLIRLMAPTEPID